MSMTIINAGFLSTIQDFGRTSFQDRGVPVSGMLDRFSGAVANILVDNHENMPLIEMMVLGGEFRFNDDAVIAITGGKADVFLDQVPIRTHQAVSISKGSTLKIGSINEGCIIYLAVAGGFNIPAVMGSASTYMRGNIGGLNGDRLKIGNSLEFLATTKTLPNMNARGDFQPDFSDSVKEIRVVLGPQDFVFSKKGIETFLTSSYKITAEYDRMGCRMEGPVIEHLGDANIISDGIAFGSIQIPGHGMPIIMLSDRQTVGGYTKIATVASADLPNLVQSKAGQEIRFKQVSVEEAQQALKDMNSKINALKRRIAQGISFYNTFIDGVEYQVTVEEV